MWARTCVGCAPFLVTLLAILLVNPTISTSVVDPWVQEASLDDLRSTSDYGVLTDASDPDHRHPHVEEEQRLLRRTAEAQIVGGNVVTSQLYPFFVQSDASVSGKVCGGSLIAKDFVLTAAHCFDAYNGSSKVLVGPYKRDSTDGPAQFRNRVGKLLIHPQNDPTTVQYDFMLFQIKPVTLSNLKPIKLNLDGSIPVAGQPLTVIGMGTNDAGTISYVLEEVVLSAVSNQQCEQEWTTSGGRSIDFASMVCASTTNGKDVCGGDSGGPLFDSQKRQVGLVSFGPSDPCANPIVSGVYARVSGAKSWIKQVVCKQSSDPPQYLCKNSNSGNGGTGGGDGGGGGGGDGNNSNSSTGNGTVPYRIEVKYGASPQFIGWKLVSPAGSNRGKNLAKVPMGRVRRPNVRLTKNVSLKAGQKYKLVIKDGSSTRQSTGYVKLYKRSKLIQTIQLDKVDRKKVVEIQA